MKRASLVMKLTVRAATEGTFHLFSTSSWVTPFTSVKKGDTPVKLGACVLVGFL